MQLTELHHKPDLDCKLRLETTYLEDSKTKT
jgi:hypothetical protein